MINMETEGLRLYFTCDSHSTGGDLIDENDEWSNRETTYIEVKFHEFYRKPPDHRFFYDSVKVDEKTFNSPYAFLAVIRYSTGDTFGHTEGCHYVVGAASSREEANIMIDHAINDKGTYKPWEGYFESLTAREVYKLDVL